MNLFENEVQLKSLVNKKVQTFSSVYLNLKNLMVIKKKNSKLFFYFHIQLCCEWNSNNGNSTFFIASVREACGISSKENKKALNGIPRICSVINLTELWFYMENSVNK